MKEIKIFLVSFLMMKKEIGGVTMESKKITKALCIIYLMFLTWIILFKMQFAFQELPDIRSINLIPFKESVMVNGKLQI